MKLVSQARHGAIGDLEDSALEAYLKVVAANTASDLLRSKRSKRRDSGPSLSLDQAANRLRSDVGDVREMDAQLFWNQIVSVLEGGGTDKERTIFLLYYRQGFTAKEIASIPALDLTVKGVESQLARTAARIRKTFAEPGEGFPSKGAS